jgi:WD40 repeat protein
MRRTVSILVALLAIAPIAAFAEGELEIIWKQDVHAPAVDAIGYSPSGGQIASGACRGNEGFVAVWDAYDGEELQSLTNHYSRICSVALSVDRRHLAVGYLDFQSPGTMENGATDLYDWGTGELIDQFHGAYTAFSPDGRLVASGGGGTSTTLEVHSVYTGELVMSIDTSPGVILDLAYAPDGETVAVATTDQSITVWSVPDGHLFASFRQLPAQPNAIAYSRDSQHLAAGFGRGTGPGDEVVMVWNIIREELVMRVVRDFASVTQVSFAPDGRFLLAAGSGEEGPQLAIYKFPQGEPTDYYHIDASDVAFSPDGRLLAFGTYDGALAAAVSPAN